jgi:hypothetical protein
MSCMYVYVVCMYVFMYVPLYVCMTVYKYIQYMISVQFLVFFMNVIVCMYEGNGDRDYLTKLHFQLRLKARDFPGVSQLHAEAERITDIVQGTLVCLYVCA